MKNGNKTITISKEEFLDISSQFLRENTKDLTEKFDFGFSLLATLITTKVLADITKKLFDEKEERNEESEF